MGGRRRKSHKRRIPIHFSFLVCIATAMFGREQRGEEAPSTNTSIHMLRELDENMYLYCALRVVDPSKMHTWAFDGIGYLGKPLASLL